MKRDIGSDMTGHTFFKKLWGATGVLNLSVACPHLWKHPDHRFRAQAWGPVLKPQNKQVTNFI